METVGDGVATDQGGRADGQAGAARPGQSGEGSRSAMELLIQQQRKREAQQPREGDASRPVAPRD